MPGDEEHKRHPDPLQHRKASRLSYLYHPYEVAFHGASGRGKTTLIQRLLKHFQGVWDLAYVKHRAHRFDLDHAGKDTHIAREAGSFLIGIADHDHAALLDWGNRFRLEGDLRWLEADAVLIEGGKDEDIAHFSFDGEHLAELCLGRVAAEGGDFTRDAIASIAERLQSYWQRLSQQRPVSGLILCGGFSERMGQDKALLSYHPRSNIRCHSRQAFARRSFSAYARDSMSSRISGHASKIVSSVGGHLVVS
jgi:molybdopterin-guanine dinucleotide biosynthesis protein A